MKKKLVTVITVIILCAKAAYPVYACTPALGSTGVTTSPDVNIILSNDIKETIDTAAKNAADDVKVEVKNEKENYNPLNNWITKISSFYKNGGVTWKKN